MRGCSLTKHKLRLRLKCRSKFERHLSHKYNKKSDTFDCNKEKGLWASLDTVVPKKGLILQNCLFSLTLCPNPKIYPTSVISVLHLEKIALGKEDISTGREERVKFQILGKISEVGDSRNKGTRRSWAKISCN